MAFTNLNMITANNLLLIITVYNYSKSTDKDSIKFVTLHTWHNSIIEY